MEPLPCVSYDRHENPPNECCGCHYECGEYPEHSVHTNPADPKFHPYRAPDLVYQLRQKAKTKFDQARSEESPAGTHTKGWAQGLLQAADLLEADPLWKAAPRMRDILLATMEHWSMGIHEYYLEAKQLLATIPKEAPAATAYKPGEHCRGCGGPVETTARFVYCLRCEASDREIENRRIRL